MDNAFSRFTNELASPVPTAPITVTCKSCGTAFDLPPDEQLWYINKFGGVMPTHCPECRKHRRRAAKAAKHQYAAAKRGDDASEAPNV